MPQVRQNKIQTIINSDAYDLAGAMEKIADTANVIIAVANVTERDALTKFDGMVVCRKDIAGRPFETWDGSKWSRNAVQSAVFNRGAGSDASFTTATTNLIWGTITAAPAGIWRIEGHLGLYGSSSAIGRIYVYTGSSPTYYKRRQDLTGTPSTYYVVKHDFVHAGGDLTFGTGYDVVSGTATAMAAASGETSVMATFLGN
jgi:hypothetical protein